MHIVQLETLEPHKTVSMGVTPTSVHEYEYEQTFQFALIEISGNDKVKMTADKPGNNSYRQLFKQVSNEIPKATPIFPEFANAAELVLKLSDIGMTDKDALPVEHTNPASTFILPVSFNSLA